MQQRHALPLRSGSSSPRKAPFLAPRAVRRRLRRLWPVIALGLLWLIGTGYLLTVYLRSDGDGTNNSSISSPGKACVARLAKLGVDVAAAARADASVPAARRAAAYAAMAAGVTRLELGGQITQGLSQADLFEQSSSAAAGPPKPRLRALDVPVRAVVLPLLDARAARALAGAVAAALKQLIDAPAGVHMQDPALLHATLFHASAHSAPVSADAAAVAAEADAVARVAGGACPVRAALERVAVTAGGALVACWQVVPAGPDGGNGGSTEPAALRASLRAALPRAPDARHQAVAEPALLHVTVARLLAPARRRGRDVSLAKLRASLARAAAKLTRDLCGLEASFGEVWYVEERDLLALGLGGRFDKRAFALRCSGPSAAAAVSAGGGGVPSKAV